MNSLGLPVEIFSPPVFTYYDKYIGASKNAMPEYDMFTLFSDGHMYCADVGILKCNTLLGTVKRFSRTNGICVRMCPLELIGPKVFLTVERNVDVNCLTALKCTFTEPDRLFGYYEIVSRLGTVKVPEVDGEVAMPEHGLEERLVNCHDRERVVVINGVGTIRGYFRFKNGILQHRYYEYKLSPHQPTLKSLPLPLDRYDIIGCRANSDESVELLLTDDGRNILRVFTDTTGFPFTLNGNRVKRLSCVSRRGSYVYWRLDTSINQVLHLRMRNEMMVILVLDLKTFKWSRTPLPVMSNCNAVVMKDDLLLLIETNERRYSRYYIGNVAPLQFIALQHLLPKFHAGTLTEHEKLAIERLYGDNDVEEQFYLISQNVSQSDVKMRCSTR